MLVLVLVLLVVALVVVVLAVDAEVEEGRRSGDRGGEIIGGGGGEEDEERGESGSPGPGEGGTWDCEGRTARPASAVSRKSGRLVMVKVGVLEAKMVSQSESDSGRIGNDRSSFRSRKGRSTKEGCCWLSSTALVGSRSRTTSVLRSSRRMRRGWRAPWALAHEEIVLLSTREKDPRTIKGRGARGSGSGATTRGRIPLTE